MDAADLARKYGRLLPPAQSYSNLRKWRRSHAKRTITQQMPHGVIRLASAELPRCQPQT
jgi:hypothetical protein